MSLFRTKSIPSNYVFSTSSTQEDPKVHEAIKRTRAAFKQQEAQMNGRALKAHSASCKDPILCMKVKCFKYGPDKIVGKPYELDREKELEDRKRRQQGNMSYDDRKKYLQERPVEQLIDSLIAKEILEEERGRRNRKTVKRKKHENKI